MFPWFQLKKYYRADSIVFCTKWIASGLLTLRWQFCITYYIIQAWQIVFGSGGLLVVEARGGIFTGLKLQNRTKLQIRIITIVFIKFKIKNLVILSNLTVVIDFSNNIVWSWMGNLHYLSGLVEYMLKITKKQCCLSNSRSSGMTFFLYYMYMNVLFNLV